MDYRLVGLIEGYFGRTGNVEDEYANIGVIGEYGAGKSHIIDSAVKILERSNDSQSCLIEKNSPVVVKISLMSILSADCGISKNGDAVSEEIEILNMILSQIKFNLLNQEKNPHLYKKTVHKDKRNILSLAAALFGVAGIVIYTLMLWQTDVTMTTITFNKAAPFLNVQLIISLIILITLFVILLKGFMVYALENNIFIKRVSTPYTDFSLEVDANNNVTNQAQYIEYIYYMIDLKSKQENKNNFLFIFEDLDRIDKSINTIYFLRDLNKKLRLLSKTNVNQEQKTNIVFLTALRTRVFEKKSKKGVNTRSIIKLEKYFDYTIYVKPIIERYKSDISFDLEELAKYDKFSTAFSDEEEKLREFRDSYIKVYELFKAANLQIYIDFRTYKSFIQELSEVLKENEREFIEETGKVMTIITIATLLRFSSKNSIDFILFLKELNLSRFKDQLENYGLIHEIEKKINVKYSAHPNDCLFSNRELELYNILLCEPLPYNLDLQMLVDDYRFMSILGVDNNQEYMKSLSNPEELYSYGLNVDELLETIVNNVVDDTNNRKYYLYQKELIKKPNASLINNLDKVFKVLFKEESEEEEISKVHLLENWIDIILIKKLETESIKRFFTNAPACLFEMYKKLVENDKETKVADLLENSGLGLDDLLIQYVMKNIEKNEFAELLISNSKYTYKLIKNESVKEDSNFEFLKYIFVNKDIKDSVVAYITRNIKEEKFVTEYIKLFEEAIKKKNKSIFLLTIEEKKIAGVVIRKLEEKYKSGDKNKQLFTLYRNAIETGDEVVEFLFTNENLKQNITVYIENEITEAAVLEYLIQNPNVLYQLFKEALKDNKDKLILRCIENIEIYEGLIKEININEESIDMLLVKYLKTSPKTSKNVRYMLMEDKQVLEMFTKVNKSEKAKLFVDLQNENIDNVLIRELMFHKLSEKLITVIPSTTENLHLEDALIKDDKEKNKLLLALIVDVLNETQTNSRVIAFIIEYPQYIYILFQEIKLEKDRMTLNKMLENKFVKGILKRQFYNKGQSFDKELQKLENY